MLRLLILLFLIGLSLKSYPQMPERKALGLVHKVTATWCTPCGTWGWTLAEDLMEQTSGKALYLGLFASGGATKRNAEFYNQTAATLASAFGFSGYPSFGINGMGKTEQSNTGAIDAERVKTLILQTADSFTSVDPLASAAGSFSWYADQLSVSARLRFWKAVEGAYYLAAYIVEDKAMNLQSGRSLTGTEVAHHDVLRASMSPESAWGQLIATDAVPDTAIYAMDFSFKVTDTRWKKENLKVYLVIWKKEEDTFRFVNAALAEGSTKIKDRTAPVNDLVISPNPATDILRLNFQSNHMKVACLSLLDLSGKRLFGPADWPLLPGANQRTLDVSWLRSGIYILRLETESGDTKTHKFILH